jgi:hypothetical protein
MTRQREQEIRERAYAIWEQEGHQHGKDLAHWFRAEAEINLVRINELRSLVKNPESSNTLFQHFEQTIKEWPPKRRQFRDIEQDLQRLDPQSWDYLKQGVTQLLQIKHPTRGWRAVFDRLNHAKAYNYLSREGCTCIRFIPESPVGGQRTPDLKAIRRDMLVLCEVKTINISEIEARRRVEGGVGTTEASVSQGFLDKLIHDIENAKEQMGAYVAGRTARKIAYIVVNFDDNLHEYSDMYQRQIDTFLKTNTFPDVEIIFDVKSPFDTAMS